MYFFFSHTCSHFIGRTRSRRALRRVHIRCRPSVQSSCRPCRRRPRAAARGGAASTLTLSSHRTVRPPSRAFRAGPLCWMYRSVPLLCCNEDCALAGGPAMPRRPLPGNTSGRGARRHGPAAAAQAGAAAQVVASVRATRDRRGRSSSPHARPTGCGRPTCPSRPCGRPRTAAADAPSLPPPPTRPTGCGRAGVPRPPLCLARCAPRATLPR